MSMIKQFLNPPNWFSAASLFCGFYAMLLAGQADGDPAKFYQAGLMIIFSGVFDMLDGRVARITKTASQFGVELDSLIDIVSFGVAPATLLYFWALKPLDMVGVFVASAYMLCGAFRLARFNCMADKGGSSNFSTGLTITAAGGTVASVVMWFAGSERPAPSNAGALVSMVLCLSWLMVSTVPYRGLKALKLSPRGLALVAVMFGACLAIAARYDISTLFVVVGVGHVLSGPLESLLTFPRRRRQRARARVEGSPDNQGSNTP